MQNKTITNLNLLNALIAFKNEEHDIKLDIEVKVTDSYGRDYNFSYASFQEIEAKIRPFLKKHNLCYVQTVGEKCSVTTTLVHITSGESMESVSSFPLEAGNSYQSYGQAITYMKRYALVAMLGLKAEFDSDGNAGSGNKVDIKVNGKPPLDDNKMQLMVNYINDGKWKEVDGQINKYVLTESQRTTLTTLINAKKTAELREGTKR